MKNNRSTDIATLCRARVSLMVGAATAFGYVLLRPGFEAGLLYVTLGTVILAGACSVWNQVQERRSDALMDRTKERPVARGSVSSRAAAIFGFLLFVLAMFLFFMAGKVPLVLLGLAVVGVYNGIYTPLKKSTCFSLLIGAVVGASPIVLGWVAAGGSVTDPLLVLLYGVYLLWQIPHFWLRVERNRADYQKAALPVPSLVFPSGLYGRILSIWFYAFTAALLMIPAFPLMHSVGMRIGVTAIGMVVFIFGAVLIQGWMRGKWNEPEHTDGVPEQSDTVQNGLGQGITRRNAPVHGNKLFMVLSRRQTLAIVDGAMLLVMSVVLLDRIFFSLQ